MLRRCTSGSGEHCSSGNYRNRLTNTGYECSSLCVFDQVCSDSCCNNVNARRVHRVRTPIFPCVQLYGVTRGMGTPHKVHRLNLEWSRTQAPLVAFRVLHLQVVLTMMLKSSGSDLARISAQNSFSFCCRQGTACYLLHQVGHNVGSITAISAALISDSRAHADWQICSSQQAFTYAV